VISDVLAYYRTRLKALGRTEWVDPDFATVPKPRLATAFHLQFGDIRGLSNNQSHQEIEVPVTVRLPYPPDRKPTTLIDTAVAYADIVLTDLLKAENRTTADGLIDVRFDTLSIEPLAETNDNGVVLVLGFTALVAISTR